MNTPHTPLDDSPLPRRGSEIPDDDRVRVLADRLDCLTEGDMNTLARIKSSTSEAWRKRGIGPPYVLFGNRVLYPREGLRKYLCERQRERHADPRTLL